MSWKSFNENITSPCKNVLLQSPFKKNSLGWELLYTDICPEKYIPTPIAQGHCSHEVTISICCQATGHKSTE